MATIRSTRIGSPSTREVDRALKTTSENLLKVTCKLTGQKTPNKSSDAYIIGTLLFSLILYYCWGAAERLIYKEAGGTVVAGSAETLAEILSVAPRVLRKLHKIQGNIIACGIRHAAIDILKGKNPVTNMPVETAEYLTELINNHPRFQRLQNEAKKVVGGSTRFIDAMFKKSSDISSLRDKFYLELLKTTSSSTTFERNSETLYLALMNNEVDEDEYQKILRELETADIDKDETMFKFVGFDFGKATKKLAYQAGSYIYNPDDNYCVRTARDFNIILNYDIDDTARRIASNWERDTILLKNKAIDQSLDVRQYTTWALIAIVVFIAFLSYTYFITKYILRKSVCKMELEDRRIEEIDGRGRRKKSRRYSTRKSKCRSIRRSKRMSLKKKKH